MAKKKNTRKKTPVSRKKPKARNLKSRRSAPKKAKKTSPDTYAAMGGDGNPDDPPEDNMA